MFGNALMSDARIGQTVAPVNTEQTSLKFVSEP